ncbi:junctional sarcoplasmic reticulum protein 1 [Pteropus vampyrus]|uniref:Junctional sarcoplasmic reticulum protein 1 n=1 Tax=Pteropus vampyrus TaxID=132908 RepID=A0A6P6D2R8_PTEVA|nr:junctional sarcoplasmic reticulum protein 1 [Pteropus vampyrus]
MTTRALEELDGGLGSCQPGGAHSSGDQETLPSPRGRRGGSSPLSAYPVGSGWSPCPQAEGAVVWRPARTAPSAPRCGLSGVPSGPLPDAVAGEAGAPTPAPEPWVPPSSSPKKPAPHLPKPVAWAPPSVPPAPQAEAEERPEVPAAAARKDEGEPGEAAGEKRAPLAHGGPKERPRKESPRKEKSRKEERPRKEEKPRRAEKPRAAREPPGALPRRWEAREGGRRPWVQESRDPEHRKRPAWASLRRPNEEDRPPGRQKHRAGKGRD